MNVFFAMSIGLLLILVKYRVMERFPGARIAFVGDGPYRCALPQ